MTGPHKPEAASVGGLNLEAQTEASRNRLKPFFRTHDAILKPTAFINAA